MVGNWITKIITQAEKIKTAIKIKKNAAIYPEKLYRLFKDLLIFCNIKKAVFLNGLSHYINFICKQQVR